MHFLEYAGLTLRAFVFSAKQQEIIDRKHDIVASVCSHHVVTPRSVLFVGFNPAILACTAPRIALTEASEEVQEYLTQRGVKFEYIAVDDLFNYQKEFEVIVAVEEYFTFAESEAAQKSSFEMICNLATRLVITTLRDYKNQDFKDREFSQPSVIRGIDQDSRIYVEYHEYDMVDRNAWQRSIYEITDDVLFTQQRFPCRHMFFKQCAKFAFDAGARDFLVHKNLMYKSLLKKNYEHVISLKFG